MIRITSYYFDEKTIIEIDDDELDENIINYVKDLKNESMTSFTVSRIKGNKLYKKPFWEK